MIDRQALLAMLNDSMLSHWSKVLPAWFDDASRHGNLPAWRKSIAALPAVSVSQVDLNQDCIVIGAPDDMNHAQRRQTERTLHAFHPWRKGPFSLFGIHIDAEWRSDWKWHRIAPALASIKGKRILDVGCGNAYFCLRLLGLRAASVIGIEPHMLYHTQYYALQKYLPAQPFAMLPCPAQALPSIAAFDVVLSMGVLYHRRSPLEHLQWLFECLSPGGSLIIESIVVDGDEQTAMVPAGRYARMRNVWFVPSSLALARWLQRSGFTEIALLHQGPTRTDEQRQTDWMHFDSLAQGLNVANPALTIEGLPAPQRAVLTARKPG